MIYIDGVFDGSGDSPRIYLVAENLDAARVKKVILHEAVGHQGMRQIFGESFNDFLRQIGSEHSAEIQKVAQRRSLDTSIDAKYLEAVEEFLAEKASLGVEDGTTWQKICAAFRQFLRNMGLNIAYSDNDIQQLFRQSLRAVQNKTGGSVGNFGSIGSVRYMAEPFTEQQKRDLLQQARNSGLKNIDVIEKMLYGGSITVNGNTVNFDGKNSHAMKLHLNAPGFTPQRGPVTVEEIQKYLPEILKQKPTPHKKKIKKNRSKNDLRYEAVINGVRYRLVTKYNGLFESFYSNRKGVGDVNSQKAGSASIQHQNNLSQNLEKSSGNQEKMRFSIASQVDTPEFKNWFGDSKVVDENGKPLVVYHGSGTTFWEFKTEFTGLGKNYV